GLNATRAASNSPPPACQRPEPPLCPSAPRCRPAAPLHRQPFRTASTMSQLMLLTMLIFFGLTVPVAVSIGLAAISGVAAANLPWLVVAQQIYAALDKYPLVAIPFFILAGNLMEAGGISERLVEFAKSLVGGVQGGLAMTCVITCMIFAAVAGSSVATTFAVGAILIRA